MRPPMVALVGVEPHFAVAERAERLAVGVDMIADRHHVVPHQRILRARCAELRRHPLGDRTEMGGEAALIVFAKILIAEQQHRMLVPSVLDRAHRLLVLRTAEIDAADFRPDVRMQFCDRNRTRPFGDWRHVVLPGGSISNYLQSCYVNRAVVQRRQACGWARSYATN